MNFDNVKPIFAFYNGIPLTNHYFCLNIKLGEHLIFFLSATAQISSTDLINKCVKYIADVI